jgi:glucosyl-dolichyl phosphate glucuronosyltransferase
MREEFNKGIEFCICTYNRIGYLKQCIGALLPQLIPGKTRLTIVDNHSTDGTGEYVQELEKGNPLVHYVFESEPGSSHARNTGWKVASYEWVFYLDDDCLPPEHFVSTALKTKEEFPMFDALGGPIDPLFTVTPPEWLPEGFGTFSLPFTTFTQIEKGFLRGGCFLIKRDVFTRIGGFNTSLGMQGMRIRYGEEIELQFRMRQAGMKIGYVPALHIGHHVRIEKLNLGWVLTSEYARRRDKMIFDPVSLPAATFNLCRTILGRLIWTPVHLFKILTGRSYSFKRALFDIFKPLAFRTGEWIGVVNHLKVKGQNKIH